MQNVIKTSCFGLFLVLVTAAVLKAAPSDWAEGSAARTDGATRDYYNRAGLLEWRNFMGDWRDALDKPQGDRPYATETVKDDDSEKTVEWDVTPLVREWLDGKHPNQGFFLRAVNSSGTIVFRSRQWDQAGQRPKLVVVGAKGSVTLDPRADTYLAASTYRSHGRIEELRVSGQANHALLRFDLSPAEKLGTNVSAKLRLVTTKQYGHAAIGVFRCSQGHDLPPSAPAEGLAAKYPGDKGISRNPDVCFFSDFESVAWAERWTQAAPMEMIDTVDRDPARKFEPFQGKALRSRLAEGSNTALNTL
ncbi:MAG: DNRLRE domain-containing protein, partial [Planctomycetes bacterium]|nr:DNRLRE domain-containing protein [Planctomycetota bacterium]